MKTPIVLTALLLLAACEPQRIGTNVRFACENPAVDTTGWQRIPSPFPGYTVLAPPTLERRALSGGDVLWADGPRSVRISRRAWGSAQFYEKNARAADFSSCWTRIGGMRSYVVVRRVYGGYQVTGWYRRSAGLPDSAGHLDGVVSGAGPAPGDQAVFLRMVRSLAPAP